eukprot:TRINITY_DN93628_c0_g1_i1.p1 TRINITY_DN93628_c0_g1~~TRINITY_DN93628_c0_g1_i1.p1  ORF type:complete len:497 (-),score=115.47 TRINITY_DN93628_c0_g1_i1:335-1825(-)
MGCATSCVCKTIKQGENYAVSDGSGRVRVVEGPQRVLRCGKSFEPLRKHVAGETEYLEIKFKDGRTEFHPGPTSAVLDPVNHVEIRCREMQRVDHGEVLIVYRDTPGKEGSKAQRTFLEGPCRYRPETSSEWTVSVRNCVASETQYLCVTHRDGSVEVIRGPTSLIVDPEKYLKAEVRPATQIGDQELIVVYRKRDDGAVQRHLVRGPRLYTPETACEWTHEFSWTGAANKEGESISGPARKKVNALQFTKLRTSPGKMYYDVENVRTKDNAQLTLRLMLFFCYETVETMLDNTNDPYGDFVNAVSADVIEWCAAKKFDEFLAATDNLNQLDIYNQLRAVAKKIGMQIQKVVFRGYEAPRALQAMHDSAIEKRTELALLREKDVEEQNLLDLKLTKEAERCSKQHALELQKLAHELEVQKKNMEAQREAKQMEVDVELAKLQKMKDIDRNLDLGRYLLAKEGRIPQVIQCGTMLAAPGADSVIDGSSVSGGGCWPR